MKGETGSGLKAPRLITQMKPSSKVQWARFMYALADFSKDKAWYGFKIPMKISERVAALVANAQTACMTDYSRFDGRVSPAVREFERMLLTAIFSRDRELVLKIAATQYNLKCTSSHGAKFKSATQRASGSAETSVLNTIFNAFVAFCAFRQDKKSPEEAYAALGIYGGDDGLTPDAPAHYSETATSLGAKLTSDVVKRGEQGITFLARYYAPTTWNLPPGEPGQSCCDIQRQLSKFHTTPVKKEDYVRLFHEKVHSYWLTDENTPLIGDLVRRAKQLGSTITKKSGPLRWNDRYEKNEQSPNLNTEGWMTELVQKQMPNFNFALFDESLKKAKTIKDLMNLPVCLAPPIEVTAPHVVNGALVAPRH